MEAQVAGQSWFLEVCEESGSVFGLVVKGKLHDQQSRFQHIEVFDTTHFGRLLVLDGFVMLSQRDNFIYHEMMVHPALFTHPAPGRVLVIGGGDCGCLREVLKHGGVRDVQQVELDEQVTRVCEQFFPELCAANDDPRASLHFCDGIEWVANAATGRYDVVIVDSTDPLGQAARLFQAEFYADCLRILDADGVLAVQSESPLIHMDLIAGIRREMAVAGFLNVSTLQFPQCSYPSGWWSVTLAGNCSLDAFRQERDDTLDVEYYNADIHRGALAQPTFLRRALAKGGES